LSLFVCFPQNITETDAARITKLGVEMFHHESWKPVEFGVKGQGHDAQKHCRRGSWRSCECWLLPVLVKIN